MINTFLIIGKPHSSKTVFLAQFYSRLQKKKSKLTLYKSVNDLSPITAARESLAKGEEPQTTPTNKSVKFLLPIQFNNQQIDLLCPEYGGEQLNNILETREVNKDWAKAIKESNNWIFFIRITSINKSLDLSKVTMTEEFIHGVESDTEAVHTLTEQSALIELLQIFLHVKEYDYHVQNFNVKLTVVMTCWDELETKLKPKQIFKSNLPLLSSFVNANWIADSLKIIGLSAQGFPLDSEENKLKYQIDGPENFGYLVKENGQKTNDITELISEAL